jgi:hypothetical protein
MILAAPNNASVLVPFKKCCVDLMVGNLSGNQT